MPGQGPGQGEERPGQLRLRTYPWVLAERPRADLGAAPRLSFPPPLLDVLSEVGTTTTQPGEPRTYSLAPWALSRPSLFRSCPNSTLGGIQAVIHRLGDI